LYQSLFSVLPVIEPCLTAEDIKLDGATVLVIGRMLVGGVIPDVVTIQGPAPNGRRTLRPGMNVALFPLVAIVEPPLRIGVAREPRGIEMLATAAGPASMDRFVCVFFFYYFSCRNQVAE
jgi:hypothetical protein